MKPNEMSDEALTKAVAEEVMGWESFANIWFDNGLKWRLYRFSVERLKQDGWSWNIDPEEEPPIWQPLHRADHWMMVVDKLLEDLNYRQYSHHIGHECLFVYGDKVIGRSFNRQIGRAVLEAALSAVRGKEGE